MNNKEIKNIVFYTFGRGNEKATQACIFYEDGSVVNTDQESGKEAWKILCKQKGLKEGLQHYRNNKYIYTLSGAVFEKYFQYFRTGTMPQRPKPEGTQKPNKVPQSSSWWENSKLRKWLKDNRVAKFIKKHFSSSDSSAKGQSKKKKSIFKRAALAIGAAATAIAVFVGGLVGCRAKTQNDADSKKEKNAIEAEATTVNNVNDVNVNLGNLKFANRTFTELVQSTENSLQAQVMKRIGNFLDKYNGTFADHYLEEGKDIRAALTWDEVMALDLVYNNYSAEELRKILNGSELDNVALSNAFKNASLQLMGAHVIETRDTPVMTGNLLKSEKARTFWNKYHNMFLACKEATGQEQINKVNAFYQELLKDWPAIDPENREVGIAHADESANIEPYKFSIIPIISAAEMMFQNLDIDYTLQDKVIDYFDDLGVCNYANSILEKASIISLSKNYNDEIPTYDQFRNIKIQEQQDKKVYVTDDEHRDLSQLDAFKDQTNSLHFEMENGTFTGKTYYTTNSYTTTDSRSKSSTSYHTETAKKQTDSRKKAVKATSEEEVKKAEKKAKKKIKQENEKAEQQGKQAAEQNRQEQQVKEDQKTAQHEQEVQADTADMQNKIDAANDQIDQNNSESNPNNNNPVNESDFGDHNVDFTPEHSDDNGNLSDSVQDITTDSSNDQTGEELPDPEQTGAVFDSQAPSDNETSSVEQWADEYVESLANPSPETEESYQYQKAR